MGVVYRARDQLLNRDVALKLMLDNVVNQRDRRARVLAEARAASALNHPGITTIYDVVETGEHLFIVMELVEGQTLRARLPRPDRMERSASSHDWGRRSLKRSMRHTHTVWFTAISSPKISFYRPPPFLSYSISELRGKWPRRL